MSVSRSRARFDVERERDKRKAWNFPGYQDRQQFRAELDCEIVDGEGLRWSPLSEATRDIASVVFFYPKEKFVDRQALASMLDKKKKYFPTDSNEPTDCNIAGARALALAGRGIRVYIERKTSRTRAPTLSLLLSI